MIVHLGLVILSTAFTMSSLKELVELGKQFGYEGETLRKFVHEEQARERDQRVEERTREREEMPNYKSPSKGKS